MASSRYVCSAVLLTVLLMLMRPAVVPAANVLVFIPMPLKSHFGGFQPLFEALALRGHNVTVVSAFPANRRIPNYTDLTIPALQFDHNFNVMELSKLNIFHTVLIRWSMAEILSVSLDNQIVRDLVQSESNSFDLIIIESFLQEYTIALGHKFNAPVINMAPSMPWASTSKWLQVPSTFSYIPDCCLGIADDMSFFERLKNTFIGVIQMYVENYIYIPKMKSLMTKYFTYKGWESRPSLEKMLRNVSLTLMNVNNVIGMCRPYLPGVVEVGGMHIKEPKPLPQNLQDYIDSAEHGVIYFSFGSLINISTIPNDILNVFLTVIGRLKQKVILKWIPKSDVKLPENVMIGSWLPQNDILAHPNVKLFITHGGFHSIEEAVYNAKPLVGIPFFADQVSNMRRIEKSGYGKQINLHDINEETFENVIKEVISNPSFKDQAMTQSRIYKDQLMKPLDRAIYWLEYVIRNNGANYLISDSAELNELQYFSIDLILASLVLMGLIIWLCYCGVKKVTLKFKTN